MAASSKQQQHAVGLPREKYCRISLPQNQPTMSSTAPVLVVCSHNQFMTQNSHNSRTSNSCGNLVKDYKPPPIIKLRSKESDEVMDENGELQTRFYQLPLFDTSDLIGRAFLTEQDNGQKHRARIVAAIEDHNANIEMNFEQMCFVCLVNNDKYEEIMTYNQIMDHIEQSEEDAIVWRFKQIAGHEAPLPRIIQCGKDPSTMSVLNGKMGRLPMSPCALCQKVRP
jgi:hypothetical protein